MEGDLFGLDLSVFDIDLVAHKTDGDAFTDSGQVLVPLGNILVCDSGADIEHNDTALPANIVPFSESTEFFLTRGVPNIEPDGSMIGVEDNGIDIDTSGCYEDESSDHNGNAYLCTSSRTLRSGAS